MIKHTEEIQLSIKISEYNNDKKELFDILSNFTAGEDFALLPPYNVRENFMITYNERYSNNVLLNIEIKNNQLLFILSEEENCFYLNEKKFFEDNLNFENEKIQSFYNDIKIFREQVLEKKDLFRNTLIELFNILTKIDKKVKKLNILKAKEKKEKEKENIIKFSKLFNCRNIKNINEKPYFGKEDLILIFRITESGYDVKSCFISDLFYLKDENELLLIPFEDNNHFIYIEDFNFYEGDTISFSEWESIFEEKILSKKISIF